MTTTQNHDVVAEAAGRRRPRRSGTVLLAVAGALAVWVLSVPLLGVDLTVGSGAGARVVSPAAVVVSSLVAGLAAIGLAAILERRTSHARSVWAAVAASTLIASFAGPFGADTLGAGIVLSVMHLVVGGLLLARIIPTLRTPCTTW